MPWPSGLPLVVSCLVLSVQMLHVAEESIWSCHHSWPPSSTPCPMPWPAGLHLVVSCVFRCCRWLRSRWALCGSGSRRRRCSTSGSATKSTQPRRQPRPSRAQHDAPSSARLGNHAHTSIGSSTCSKPRRARLSRALRQAQPPAVTAERLIVAWPIVAHAYMQACTFSRTGETVWLGYRSVCASVLVVPHADSHGTHIAGLHWVI